MPRSPFQAGANGTGFSRRISRRASGEFLSFRAAFPRSGSLVGNSPGFIPSVWVRQGSNQGTGRQQTFFLKSVCAKSSQEHFIRHRNQNDDAV